MDLWIVGLLWLEVPTIHKSTRRRPALSHEVKSMTKSIILCAALYFGSSFPLFSQGKSVFHHPLNDGNLWASETHAQEPWPFFPLHTRNYWRYQIGFGGGIYGYNQEAIVDSMLVDNEWFLKKRVQLYSGGLDSSFLRQEDSTYIKEKFGLGQFAPLQRLYKIDAADGERWLAGISPDDSSRKVWARLDSTSQMNLFSETRASKHYRVWQEFHGQLEWTKNIVLVYGIGLVRLRGGEGGVDFDDIDLVGAIINGTTFGEPLSVDSKTESVPSFFLANYPNPFSATMTIEVHGSDSRLKRDVQIKIYNLAGQIVRTLYQGSSLPNQQLRMKWDGRDDAGRTVPLGAYFLSARSGDLVQNRKILLLRQGGLP